MITTGILQKYAQNIKILLISIIGCIITITLFIIVLKFKMYSELIICILTFIFFIFSEITYLNLLIVNLHITPKGMEGKSSLIFGVCSRFGTIVGVVLAPHIVANYG